jgi:gliding motility associated protien GldN
MWGIKNKSLTPFQSHLFESQFTMDEIDGRFGASIDTIYEIDPDTGESIPIITINQAEYSEVKEFLVKEMWFFDKQRSVIEVRIIGLAPIRMYYRPDDIDQEDQRQTLLFWIYYPEARNIFAGEPVYSELNQATTYTFDDIFFKRRFSGFIFKESNVYDDRAINEYTTGLDVLLESESIKKKIFDYEHDMWEY